VVITPLFGFRPCILFVVRRCKKSILSVPENFRTEIESHRRQPISIVDVAASANFEYSSAELMYRSILCKLRNYELPRVPFLAFGCVAVTFLFANCLYAQSELYRITFVDKGPNNFHVDSAEYLSVKSEFHSNALKRRQLTGFTPLLTDDDRPIYSGYTNAISALGITTSLPLRWRNCVTATLTEQQRIQCSNLSFVKSVVKTSEMSYRLAAMDCTPADPGVLQLPTTLLGVDELHDAGVFGKGARICMIDNGFDARLMSSMQHLDIEKKYDFVYSDTIVQNEPDEPADQSGHGSLVLSVVGAWLPDSIVGIAPFATFYVAKTEDMRSERRIEEDNLCAAIEWAERNGADIASTSVVYYFFDSTQQVNTYSLLDGKTAFASRAVNMAAERGLLFVCAIGNSGTSPRTLEIPADADSSISVGAMLDADSAWYASSYGPTADGRQKPEVMALGVDVVAQTAENTYKAISGTSIAAPQIAGVLALIKQMHPNIAPYQIKNAMYTSSQFELSGLTKIGRGFPNASNAVREIGTAISEPAVLVFDTVAVVVPIFSYQSEMVVLSLFADDLDTVNVVPVRSINNLWYIFKMPDTLVARKTIRAIITTQNNQGFSARFPTNDPYAILTWEQTNIPCGMRLPSRVTHVADAVASSPAPPPLVWPNPVARESEHINVRNVGHDVLFVEVLSMNGNPTKPCTFVVGENSVGENSVGENSISVTIPSRLTAGMYYVRVTCAAKTFILPLVVM